MEPLPRKRLSESAENAIIEDEMALFMQAKSHTA